MVKKWATADIITQKLFKHVAKVLNSMLNLQPHQKFQKLKTNLSTTGDSYYFRIKSSICEKIQRHQMGFEQQIWFLIHFLHFEGFQIGANFDQC